MTKKITSEERAAALQKKLEKLDAERKRVEKKQAALSKASRTQRTRALIALGVAREVAYKKSDAENRKRIRSNTISWLDDDPGLLALALSLFDALDKKHPVKQPAPASASS